MAGLDRCDDTSSLLIHGAAVRLGDQGILLIGRSGSGKSDLALQLIDRGAVLIADDQVRLSRSGNGLYARSPASLAGLIEIRGVGIARLPHAPGRLHLAVDLDAADADLIRLPEPETRSWHGIDLPLIRIDARAPGAAAKIRIAALAERVA